MTFFLICGIGGLLLLLISMFSGHDSDISTNHDFGHDGGDNSIGVFSFRTITVFSTAFGVIGAVCLEFEMSTLVSCMAGTAAGLLFGFVSWWMMNFALQQQANSVVNASDMIGKKAIVRTTIPKNGIGEISIEINGQRKNISARANGSDITILENTQVEIVENSAGVVIVQSVK